MSAMSKDHSASVLARLLNHSRIHKEDYQSLLIRYVGERFLYRLGRSSFRDDYVLKGAYLLSITLEDHTYRTTKDIDFLKTGDSGAQHIQESLRSICSIAYPEDAVKFDLDSISIQDIREHNAYQGQRAKIQTYIGKARVVLQIDNRYPESRVYSSRIELTFRGAPYSRERDRYPSGRKRNNLGRGAQSSAISSSVRPVAWIMTELSRPISFIRLAVSTLDSRRPSSRARCSRVA